MQQAFPHYYIQLFIDDEKNHDEIYESIESEYKELNFFVEDDKTLEPCPWYKSIFKKNADRTFFEERGS